MADAGRGVARRYHAPSHSSCPPHSHLYRRGVGGAARDPPPGAETPPKLPPPPPPRTTSSPDYGAGGKKRHRLEREGVYCPPASTKAESEGSQGGGGAPTFGGGVPNLGGEGPYEAESEASELSLTSVLSVVSLTSLRSLLSAPPSSGGGGTAGGCGGAPPLPQTPSPPRGASVGAGGRPRSFCSTCFRSCKEGRMLKRGLQES